MKFHMSTGLAPVCLLLGSAHALKMGAYWSAFAFPNVPPTVASGGGNATKLDEVYLFAVDMAGTKNADHPDPQNSDGQFYRFADTWDTATSTNFEQGTAKGPAPFAGAQPAAADAGTGTPTVKNSPGKSKSHGQIVRDLLKPGGGLKVICVFGGWAMDAGFKTIASDAAQSTAFAKAAVRFIATNDYDGIDIDWEYPGSQGSTPTVYANFLKVIKDEMKSVGTTLNKNWTLSIAVPAKADDLTAVMPNPSSASAALTTMKDNVDVFNAMAYDAANGASTQSGPSTGGGIVKQLLKDLTVTYGIPASKISAGWAAFSRQWPLDGTKAAACGSGTITINSCKVKGLGGYTGMALPTMTCDFPMNQAYITANNLGTDAGWATLWTSWTKALASPTSDNNGTSFYIDEAATPNPIFWTFATANDISSATYGCPKINQDFSGLYGHFVFSLNEDAAGSPVINAVTACATA